MLVASKIAKAKSLGELEDDAYLNHMTAKQISKLLLAHLPFIKLKDGQYMIGTEKKTVMVRSNTLMIRVGGGYATLEEYLHQNAPFECIKIAMVMKDKKYTFKEAVKYYLTKHKAGDKVIKDYMKTSSSN